jgi:LysR family hydrogen peroxide-inducible transcriptional activator
LSGPLRLGAIPTIAPYLLPRVLPALRRAYGDLKLYLREDVTKVLLERLRAGGLDVALIALPFDTGDLYVRELFRDDFSLVTREADRAVGNKVVALRKIDTGDMLLLEEGHCLRDHAIAACGPRRGTWESRVEATSLTTLIQMVEGGLGMTLLPGITLEAGILKGTRLVARRFSPPVPSRMLALVARRTSPRHRDADLLADFLIEQRRGSR